jgi:predicted negative regulator of RcsB-dependent stress response
MRPPGPPNCATHNPTLSIYPLTWNAARRMAQHLQLEEQEQIDQLKAFWRAYGNLITWVVILVLAAFAGWSAWNWYQRDQAVKASAMYGALDEALKAQDVERATRVFTDLKDRFPNTAFAEQAALQTARLQADKGQADAARASLTWASENALEVEYRTIARLRLAGLLLDEKKYDEANKQLDGATAAGFGSLVDDRRGDILLAQGKRDEARAAYVKALDAMDSTIEYRRLVEGKVNSLGGAPAAAAAATSGASR